jgi:hypothetical protein
MLTIKNPKKIIGMKVVGDVFTLKEAEEHDDRYSFSFQDKRTNWAIINISRKSEWDAENARNMYRVDNGTGRIHRISADWFAIYGNVHWTFDQSLKDL